MADLTLVRGERYSILSGPGKYDWLTAFGHSGPANARLSIVMEVKRIGGGAQTWYFWVYLDSLQHESGGGNSWNFTGTSMMSGQKVKGYYSTAQRSGWFEVMSSR